MNSKQLSKLSDADLAAAIEKLATRTNETSQEVWFIVGAIRYFGENMQELVVKVTNRIRTNNHLSVVQYSKNPPYTRQRGNLPPVVGCGRKKFFTSDEIRHVENIAKRRKWAVYNGCTHAWLANFYKCDIYHELGVGYFRYPGVVKSKAA